MLTCHNFKFMGLRGSKRDGSLKPSYEGKLKGAIFMGKLTSQPVYLNYPPVSASFVVK